MDYTVWITKSVYPDVSEEIKRTTVFLKELYLSNANEYEIEKFIKSYCEGLHYLENSLLRQRGIHHQQKQHQQVISMDVIEQYEEVRQIMLASVKRHCRNYMVWLPAVAVKNEIGKQPKYTLEELVNREYDGWVSVNAGGNCTVLFKDMELQNTNKVFICVSVDDETALIYWSEPTFNLVSFSDHIRPLTFDEYKNNDERFFNEKHQELILEYGKGGAGDSWGLLTLEQLEEVKRVQIIFRQYFGIEN
ncbi:hypothetical protein N752_05725 [Desulforamulus aquiferis]|nr:hypothetical protein [Desulforamulus aquiferis]RYD06147.1 hypothetical protein N752_05725 [Desulforamulus aquiferis]